MSDRFLRKAEAGGPVEAKSLALLAAFYSSNEGLVSPGDLLAEPSVVLLPRPQSPSRLLERLLDEIWNRGRLEIVDEFFADGLRFCCEAGTLRSPAALRERFRAIRRSFRDFSVAIEALAESAVIVECRWRMTMVHVGPWRGIEPTNRRVTALGYTSVRIPAEKIAEGCEFWDPQLTYREPVQ